MASPQRADVEQSEGGRRRNVRVLVLVLMVLGVVFVVGYVQRLSARDGVAAEIASLEARIADAQLRQNILADQLQDVEKPSTLAAVARDELNMVLEGDQPIVILDPPAATATPKAPMGESGQARGVQVSEKPPWQQWWELVWGE
ncbi:MAG: septum formation initiator family protein [Anaerolineales bacterium]|nr:septum formation initiator family protein [Anaerolineales bacterium]